MKLVIGIGNPGREYAETRHNVGFRVVDRVGALLSVGADSFRSRRKFKCLMADVRARLGGQGGHDGQRGQRGQGGGQVAGDEERVLLVKPETFVNLSGECVRAVVDYFGLGVDSLLVVSDDVNLPLGRLRVRPGGSSGGHNGIESIIRHLGTEEFPRLRIGVGRPGRPGRPGRDIQDGQDRRRPPSGASGASGASGGSGASLSDSGARGVPLTRHVLGRFGAEERTLAEQAEARAAEAVMEWAGDGVEACMNRFNS